MFQINLKRLRERNKWSQVDLAKRLGVSQSTVGMWEAGRNKPTYATLIRIANEFGVSVDALTGGQSNSYAPCASLSPEMGALSSETMGYTTRLALPETQRITMPDDSMLPEIHSGDLLMIRAIQSIEPESLIAFLYKKSLYVRKAFLSQGSVIATAFAPSVPPICFPLTGYENDGILLLGEVCELARKYF